ncbi:rhodanese-like domain-containing protein [Streptomyces sp. NPDC046203]|uniref:rhodanese-like domain-containing protein n=1 Tax=Streptomyces sp. NPDC046203 TaxID=3154602 RepID=UPI003410C27C
MAREVDLEAFAAAWTDGAFVLDVRQPGEYRDGHVPGALLAPLPSLGVTPPKLPAGQPVYVICASGNRSKAAADLLAAVHARGGNGGNGGGGAEIYSVAGGTRGWIRMGRPVVTGTEPGSA